MTPRPGAPRPAPLLAALAVLLLLVGGRPALGQAPPPSGDAAARPGRTPLHMVVVLDTSGSMEDSDPQRLSVLAAQIVTDLSSPADRLGLLTMGRGGLDDYVLAPLGPVEGRRERLQRELQRIRFDGATDCVGPLREAADRLREARQGQGQGNGPGNGPGEEQAEQVVVFLSDGICPSGGDEGDGSDGRAGRELRAAAEALAGDGVRVFAIGMFGEAALEERADPSADLRSMATISGGEYFRARQAADLPVRFSEILGRIIGSEAVGVDTAPGTSEESLQQVRAELDGYVWDASLIVTASSPVAIASITGPDGADLPLPAVGDPPFAARRGPVWMTADANGRGQHYAVARITSPAAGPWRFGIDGPADARALLIQNYALDPILERAPARDVYRVGEPFEARVWLRGRDGERLEDPEFLERLAITVELQTPGDATTRVLEAETTAMAGVFTATVAPGVEGPHRLRARVAMRGGGLDKSTAPQAFRAFELALALADGQGPIDLGALKAGTPSPPLPLDLSATEGPVEVALDASLETLEGLQVAPTAPRLTPEDRVVALRFAASEDHPGGPVAGTLLLEAGGATLRVPVHGEVVPITFWERWGDLLLAIGIGLLALLALAFVVYGFASPHSFTADARLHWGETMARLAKNEVVIRELDPARGRGFFRNAKLPIGGPTGFLHDGTHRATLEATGPGRMTLLIEPGIEVHKIDRFDASKARLVEARRIPIHSGEIYRLGDTYVRIG